MPPQIADHVKFDALGRYFPVLYFDEFWLMRDHLIPINDTVKELNLSMSYSTFSLMKWQMFMQMEQSFAMQESIGTAAEGESEEFKVKVLMNTTHLPEENASGNQSLSSRIDSSCDFTAHNF